MSIKPAIIAAITGSSIAALTASWGYFQDVQVYERPFSSPFVEQYKIIREHDREIPNVQGHTIALDVQESYGWIKYFFSLAGTGMGIMAVSLSVKQEKRDEAEDYQNYIENSKLKIDLDWDVAIHSKKAAELAALKSGDILDELSANKFYQQLKENEEHIEAGIEWNPFVEDNPNTVPPQLSLPTNPDPVGDDIKNDIITRYKATGDLRKAIEEVTGIPRDDPRFLDVVRRLKV